MPVIGAAFLFAIEPAPAQAGVGLSLESMSSTIFLGGRRWWTFNPLAGQIGEHGKVLRPAEPFRPEPAHLAR